MEVTETRKDTIGLPGHLASFCTWSKLWFELRAWPLGAVGTAAYSGLDVHICLILALSLAELPHVVSPLEFCAHEAWRILHAKGVARTRDMRISHSLPKFQYPIGLLLQNTSSKVKSLRIQDGSLRVLKQSWEPFEPFAQVTCLRSRHVWVCVCLHKHPVVCFWQEDADPFTDCWRSVWPHKMIGRYCFRRIIVQKRTLSLCEEGGNSYFSPLSTT